MSRMKKSMKIPLLMAIVTCIISISGSYAATNYAISASKVGYTDNYNLGATDVQAAIDGTCTKFSNQLTELKKSMYPVGSIYFSATLSTTDEVSELLGGKWEIYGKGKTLIGVDSSDNDYKNVNKTGGSKSTHIQNYNLPGRTLLSLKVSEGLISGTKWLDTTEAGFKVSSVKDFYEVFGDSLFSNQSIEQPINIVQPYITVYMYKRTS